VDVDGNRGNKPVLLIDGEELADTKQHRVLNTSILLKEASETKIPVSCTERGRWSDASKGFSKIDYATFFASLTSPVNLAICSEPSFFEAGQS